MRLPSWRVITALGALVAVIVAVIIWHGRLGADFLPVDASRVSPNILAGVIQYAVILIILALIWPPTRKRLERAAHRFADRKLAAVHDGIGRLVGHHEKHHDDLAALRSELAEHREHDLARHAEHAEKLDRLMEAQDGKTRE